MPAADVRPAPIAKITVAAPVTMSPPAKTPGLLVARLRPASTSIFVPTGALPSLR